MESPRESLFKLTYADLLQRAIELHEELEHERRAAIMLGREVTRLEVAIEIDQLTQIKNRFYFDTTLRMELQNYFENPQDSLQYILCIADLNDLKRINDSRGHSAGDFALKETASCMQQSVREQDTVGRYAGDEFYVVLRVLASDVTACEKLTHSFANRLHAMLAPSGLAISLGFSLLSQHDSVDTAIQAADFEMYRQKREKCVAPGIVI
jgi:diguanylate cyclase (GGDEF)-like protein